MLFYHLNPQTRNNANVEYFKGWLNWPIMISLNWYSYCCTSRAGRGAPFVFVSVDCYALRQLSGANWRFRDRKVCRSR